MRELGSVLSKRCKDEGLKALPTGNTSQKKKMSTTKKTILNVHSKLRRELTLENVCWCLYVGCGGVVGVVCVVVVAVCVCVYVCVRARDRVCVMVCVCVCVRKRQYLLCGLRRCRSMG